MKQILLSLYKVTWKHTAHSYVVAHIYSDLDKIKDNVRQHDNRCDDIVSVEVLKLPSFDNDDLRKEDYVSLFMETNIL